MKYAYKVYAEVGTNFMTIIGVTEHPSTEVASIEELVKLDILAKFQVPCTFEMIFTKAITAEGADDSVESIYSDIKYWDWSSIEANL